MTKKPNIPHDLVLTGGLIELRPLTKKDYPALQKILSDPTTMDQLRYMAHLDHGGWTREQVVKRCEERRLAHKNQRGVSFVVHDKQNDAVMGSCSLKHVDLTHKNVEFGIILHHPFWGKGISAECCRLCFAYVFETLGLHRIELCTFVTNKRMRHFFEGVGIPLEGIKKETYLEEGRFVDGAVYVLLEQDWPTTRVNLEDRIAKQT